MPTTRSETSPRHWDTICLTIVTISTATVGATVVLAGVPEISPANGAPSIIKGALAFLAAGFHVALTGLTAFVIFDKADRRSQRRRQHRSLVVYLMFFTVIILLAATLITNLFSDLVAPLLDQETIPVHYK